MGRKRGHANSRQTVATTRSQRASPTKKKAARPSSNIRSQRGRIAKSKDILPPSEASLNMNFPTKTLHATYSKISTRKIVPCKYVHFETLDDLGLRNEFDELIDEIGWKSYVDINCPAFVELTREFYTTFKFNPPKDLTLDSPGVVNYRLMGSSFTQSITEFNLAFGFITEEFAHTDSYKNSRVNYDREFQHVAVWNEMSLDRSTYNPSKSEGTYLRKPVWQYVYRFLAYSFSGRKARSVTCSKAELFFIWAMSHGIKVNLGCWLATQFQSVINKKRDLILGSYITHLAVNLGLLDLESCNLHKACEMEPLDSKCLQRMGIVKSSPDGWRLSSPGRAPTLAKIREGLRDSNLADTIEGGEDTPSHMAAPSSTVEESHVFDMERRVKRMETNLDAYFQFVQFKPPCPLTP